MAMVVKKHESIGQPVKGEEPTVIDTVKHHFRPVHNLADDPGIQSRNRMMRLTGIEGNLFRSVFSVDRTGESTEDAFAEFKAAFDEQLRLPENRRIAGDWSEALYMHAMKNILIRLSMPLPPEHAVVFSRAGRVLDLLAGEIHDKKVLTELEPYVNALPQSVKEHVHSHAFAQRQAAEPLGRGVKRQ